MLTYDEPDWMLKLPRLTGSLMTSGLVCLLKAVFNHGNDCTSMQPTDSWIRYVTHWHHRDNNVKLIL